NLTAQGKQNICAADSFFRLPHRHWRGSVAQAASGWLVARRPSSSLVSAPSGRKNRFRKHGLTTQLGSVAPTAANQPLLPGTRLAKRSRQRATTSVDGDALTGTKATDSSRVRAPTVLSLFTSA